MASSGKPRFFVLEGRGAGEHDVEFLVPEDARVGDAPRCPTCGDPLGMLQWLPPYEVELELFGSLVGDWVFGTGGNVLVSERVVRGVASNDLVGFSFAPARVRSVMAKGAKGRLPHLINPLSQATISLGRTRVDDSMSRIERETAVTCSDCRYAPPTLIEGFELESDSWDGLDVFRPRALHFLVLVSERFKQVADANAWTNLTLTPTEQYRLPKNLNGGLQPQA